MLFPPTISAPSRSRVAITGVGIITALGAGWAANSAGFRQGRPAFRPVSLFDVTRQRVKVAAEIDLPEAMPPTLLSKQHLRRLDRAGKMLLLAAHEAWTQSGWQPMSPLPIVLGTTSGGMSLGQDYYRQAVSGTGSRQAQAERVTHYQCQRQGLDLADAFGFQGPITIIANACASGSNAIGHAFEMIRSGRATRVLTGGYDALSQLVFAGFDSLQALSTSHCRPFDAHRDGLALGEGAAVLTLESFDEATQRGAKILGEIVGYGAANDSHHLTQPHPEGDAALASMTEATRDAGLKAEQIGYINAHGTGTTLNDSAEAAAINRWAGTYASQVQVSSTKSSIGHLLGAAGAVEAAICVMALKEGWLPPTTSIADRDPACQFSVVSTPTNRVVEFALSNSFGFGGANASLVFRRPQ